MWKSVVGHDVSMKVAAEGDDWETDPDFENDVSEQEQRWGAKTIEGSGRKEHISIAELRDKVAVEHEQVKQKDHTPKASYGYGGKFGVEKDRMDKVALGNDYVAQVEQHSSQKDAARGFGGKFGVQKDRVDKSAMGFEYKGEVQQHASQKGEPPPPPPPPPPLTRIPFDPEAPRDVMSLNVHVVLSDHSKGFGGKYGVEKEKVDKAALGYDYKGETEKHQSQKDYSKGFGGKFGVEKDNVDKAALGYDYKSKTEKHQSQKDYSAGFGGRYGVQADRMDKSAVGFSDMDAPTSAYEKTQPVEASSAGAGKLKARFENMAKASDEENKKKADEERARRQAREGREREVAARRQEEESRREEERVPPSFPDEAEDEAPDAEDKMPPPEIHHHMPEIQEIPEPEEEPDYEEPPALPPRLDSPPPPVPGAQAPLEEDGEPDDPPPLPPPVDDYEDMSTSPQAVAIYDYQGEDDDEISFNPDDVITHIEMIDEGWWKGQCNGRVGLFPSAYVQLRQ
ncbi:src substrate protein p85-like isoform X1 [Pungitius pungitius]|uniref:src substrate protein p85-like isoform X1 n=1 Tax=Pungitius pungitius TaxID=134920 RepID=UPI002E167B88